MERVPYRPEVIKSNETAYAAALDQIELEYVAGREPNYEPIFKIMPELQTLQFDFINPAYPDNDMLRHSLLAATLAEYDIVRKALPLHDIAKASPRYQKWSKKGDVSIMKFPGHELAGAAIARPILGRVITGSDPCLHPYGTTRDAKIELMLNIIRYHDSWGDNLDHDLLGVAINFDVQTIQYLFDAQRADLMAHSEAVVEKHIGRLDESQRQIATMIIAKSSLAAQRQH